MPYRNVSFGTAVPSFTTNVYICTNMADEHTELEEDKEDGYLGHLLVEEGVGFGGNGVTVWHVDQSLT